MRLVPRGGGVVTSHHLGAVREPWGGCYAALMTVN